MGWNEGPHVLKAEQCPNTMETLALIEGDIGTKEAQSAFAQYCQANPGFTAQLLMGIDLYPIQDIMIRAMMQKDSFLGICGRGFGKSTIAGVFIPLYALFNPGTTIGITSASFRQARSIFEKIESTINEPKGRFLKQCLKGDIKHKSDAWEMTLGSSKIVALPLGCLDKDTLVWTNYGWQKIEALCHSKEKDEWSPLGGVSVYAKEGETRVSHAVYSGIKNSFKFTTRHGYEITASEDHKLLVWKENEGAVWMKASSIGTQDLLILDMRKKPISQPIYNTGFNTGYEYGQKQVFNDEIDERILSAGEEFGRGFICGFFEQGGKTSREIISKSLVVTVKAANLQVAKDLQVAFSSFGVVVQRMGRELILRRFTLKYYLDNIGEHKRDWSVLVKAEYNKTVYSRSPTGFRLKIRKSPHALPEDFFTDRVASKVNVGERETYDLRVPGFSNFAANGFCSHNSGDKIRGYRFNLLVIDELLLLSERIINEVLKPFMAIQADPRERKKVRDAQEKLIQAGLMKEEERIRFPNNKLIGLTSASYEFEYLYKMYCDYKDVIFDEKAEDVSNAIMQLSCEIAPEGLYDLKNIEDAKRTFSRAQYDREYMASFTGDSSGFYSARKLYDITLPEGVSPTLRVTGDDTKEYILAIDPNYDASESSDHFAMCLFEISGPNEIAYFVHGYAVASATINERMAYLKYLFDNFNIVYVIHDKAGGDKFIKDFNDMGIMDFKLEWFENEILGFTEEEVADARASYDTGNMKFKRIVHSQYFDTKWIRIANEALQGAIENKKIYFASKLDPELANMGNIPIKDILFDETAKYGKTKEDKQLKFNEFCDHQQFIVELTKKECAMIEVSTTANGTMRFDLPSNIKNQTGPNKARKDSYSVLVLANWAKDCYYAIKSEPKKTRKTFKPRFIR